MLMEDFIAGKARHVTIYSWQNSHLPMEAHNQETYAIAVKSHGEEIYEHVQTQINHVFKTTRRELPPTSMAIEMGI